MKMTTDYRAIRAHLLQELLWTSSTVDVGEWHAQDISGKPDLVSEELQFVNFRFWVPGDVETLQVLIQPNLPWAEDHFQERVGGIPLNPSPSEAWWPFAVAGNAKHKEGEIFSHTYPERMWPCFANIGGDVQGSLQGRQSDRVPRVGIRYAYGDLDDLVDLMIRSPLTRQAYLPIWFPEDTGAVDGQRVPCSLGYHFMARAEGDKLKLHCHYTMRSCDFVRHFADDMYMASRLLQFIVGKLQGAGHDLLMGHMHVSISSLHYFAGDQPTMVKLLDEWNVDDFD